MSCWSEWRCFPDPGAEGRLDAPFGPGVYELRNCDQLVYVGESRTVAYRMTSLLPKSCGGAGTRKNRCLREYVAGHLRDIEYRTRACATKAEARRIEQEMRCDSTREYVFPT